VNDGSRWYPTPPRLRAAGMEVLIEAGAGARAKFPDGAYAGAGATVTTADEVYDRADVLACVSAAGGAPLHSGQVLLGLLQPLARPDLIGDLARAGVTAISLDLLPRTLSRAQSMDALTSQASVAGYKAVLVAADAYGGYFPMMMTAAGTVKPATVLVLGAGVAGLQAMGTARRLGAIVTGYDVRPETRQEIASPWRPVYLLHAPDFLGYASALDLARNGRGTQLVERGLKLKKAGNAIMELVGGRAIHPVNVRVGGFYRAPATTELTALAEQLRAALDLALDTVTWAAGFEFPDFEHDHEMLALVRPGQYAIDRGTVASTRGLRFPPAEFEDHIIEEQVPHSTALHARLAGRGRYLTGPTARYALSRQWLSPLARQAADAAGLGADCRNPFRSILVRAVEVVYAVEEALRLIERYEPPA
jgi:Alanine dehydrogenase/PNT, N-terminal domain/Alanine dehydrogenase/PNT, C-terminal domain